MSRTKERAAEVVDEDPADVPDVVAEQSDDELDDTSADGAETTDGEAGNGEVAQNRIFEFKHPSTHTFPDNFPPERQFWTARGLA